MQRVVGAPRQVDIDGDQVLHRRDLGGEDDAVAREADLLGPLGGEERRLHHRLAGDGAHVGGVGSRAFSSIRWVSSSWSSEPQLTPIRTGLPWRMRGLDDGAELAVLLLLEADIAGIDAVLVERLGAGRILGEELVADVMEVADDRHVDAARQRASP